MSQQTITLALAPFDAAILRPLFADENAEFRDVEHARWQARLPGVVATFYNSGKLLLQGADAVVWAGRVANRTGARVPAAKPATRAAAPATPKSAAAPASTRSAMAAAARTAPAPELSDAVEPGSSDASASPVWAEAPAASSANAGARFGPAIARLPRPTPSAWIGIDETGKGDYFGPLVTCAARVSTDQLGWLDELGVGDSKQIDDRTVIQIAALLKPVIPHQILVLNPLKYNELYAKFQNLNKLLAWCHATAAENLLEKTTAELILSDQFTQSEIVPRYFKGKGKALRYTQRTRAEEDPAVGCASIFARAEFLFRMKALEREFGVRLHKGAGSPVLAAGRQLLREHGRDMLPNVAKLHFKTTQQIGG